MSSVEMVEQVSQVEDTLSLGLIQDWAEPGSEQPDLTEDLPAH